MFPEDSCLWVYGVGEDGVPAFTRNGIDNLRQIIVEERAAGRAPTSTEAPAAGREAVVHLRGGFAMSERRACGRAVWLPWTGRACATGTDGAMTSGCASG